MSDQNQSDRNMDFYLASGIALDGTTQNLKEADERSRQPIPGVRTPSSSRSSGGGMPMDGVELLVAGLYDAIPKWVYFLLAIAGGAYGYLVGFDWARHGAFDQPEIASAITGALAGFFVVPLSFAAFRIGWFALKAALLLGGLYLLWKFVVYPFLVSQQII